MDIAEKQISISYMNRDARPIRNYTNNVARLKIELKLKYTSIQRIVFRFLKITNDSYQ